MSFGVRDKVYIDWGELHHYPFEDRARASGETEA